MRSSSVGCAILLCCALAAVPAQGDPAATAGYPEPVVQWGVQKDETCEDIAKAVYGSAKHATLVLRYNRVDCTRGKKLKEGQTLVLPASVTSLPTARLKSLNPDVKARPSGGSWGPAAAGQPLSSNAGVSTQETGRADIEFIDRTRVFLASNTLVIIYGTASQSSVSKTPPPSVEVQSGEVKAGLAALRGESVEVAVKGGGRVSAASRETIVERKGERTTVGVYDGKASVSSGGKSVHVPLNYATRWVGTAAPSPPRPLPPAPLWETAMTSVVLGAPTGGVLRADWSAVKDAKSYRVEIARDEGFRDLITREEVAGTVRSFRAENMIPGRYYVAVRAIDAEEYLGVAATKTVDVIALDVTAKNVVFESGQITANPYAVVAFKTGVTTDLALDEGPFGPMPASLDLVKRAPARVRFRPAGSSEIYEVPVKYTDVSAAVAATLSPDAKTATIEVNFRGLEGIDIAARVAPVLRTSDGKTTASAPLLAKDGRFVAIVAAPAEGATLRADVLDGRGAVLGTGEITRPKAETIAPPSSSSAPKKYPVIGLTTESFQPSPVTGVAFWTPTARDAGTAAAQAQIGAAGAGFRFQGSATGALGPLGFEALFRSQTLGDVDSRSTTDRLHDDSAWLGARWRAFRFGDAELEGGVAARVGFPVSDAGPGVRFEPAFALGGVRGSFTWLANLGARLRLAEAGAPTPDVHGFLLAGGTVSPLDWLRFGATIDAHVLHFDAGDALFRGGLSLHAEAGTFVYGAVSLRLSPWEDDGSRFRDGPFTGQLAVGLRAP